MAAPAAHEWD